MNQIEQLMELADQYMRCWGATKDRQALRAAIEQVLGSGEPVAYRQWNSDEGYWYYGDASCAEKGDELLYTAPQPQREINSTTLMSSTSDTALLRQALEALEEYVPPSHICDQQPVGKVIAALRERLKL